MDSVLCGVTRSPGVKAGQDTLRMGSAGSNQTPHVTIQAGDGLQDINVTKITKPLHCLYFIVLYS